MRLLLTLTLSLPLVACSTFTGYGVGPAVVAGDGKTAMGLAGEVAKGEGSAGEKGSTYMDTRARVLVAREHQQIAGLLGWSSFRWIGTGGAFISGLSGGFGIEHADGTLFFDPVVQARSGAGFVLSSSERIYDANWWGREAGCPLYQRSREKKVLTLGLAADVDARFTRSPFYAVQLLVGIADVSETGIAFRAVDPLPRGHDRYGCP